MKRKLVHITFLIYLCSKSIDSNNFYGKIKTMELLNDLPSHTDFWDYLSALERIINFWSPIKHKMDLNCIFGLFLVNVNLKPFNMDASLPKYLQNHLSNLLTKNDEIQDFYKLKVKNQQSMDSPKDKIFVDLFRETTWSNKLVEFNHKLLELQYDIEYPEWETYMHDVGNVDLLVPNPKLSDKCLSYLLAWNKEYPPQYPGRCTIPNECYFAQMFGTNFGYALTHRLLFLLVARFSKGCTMFSTKTDAKIRHTYCGIIYKEAEYIASNGFKAADLMFEQMALCSLDGHAQFLRRSWISQLLQHQTPSGCFTQGHKPEEVQNSEGNNSTCNDHVTSVAVAALASAIRLILETY